MKLSIEVGLGTGHIVLDGDPASLPQKGAQQPPQFLAHVCCGQRAGWIKMLLGREVDLDPGEQPLPPKGHCRHFSLVHQIMLTITGRIF